MSATSTWEHGRVSPTATRVVVNGRAQESETKTRSGERMLALDPSTRQALATYVAVWAEERYLLGQHDDLLFVWPDGRALHPDTITALFHKHCKAAELPKIRLHDVRHSYATAALQAGVPAKVVSERLGHATAAFTLQVYSHVIPGMDQHAADTVAGGLILWPGAPNKSGLGPESGPVAPRSALEKQLAWAKAQASGGSGGSSPSCASAVERRPSPAPQGRCQGRCHPLLIAGSKHITRTVDAGSPRCLPMSGCPHHLDLRSGLDRLVLTGPRGNGRGQVPRLAPGRTIPDS